MSEATLTTANEVATYIRQLFTQVAAGPAESATQAKNNLKKLIYAHTTDQSTWARRELSKTALQTELIDGVADCVDDKTRATYLGMLNLVHFHFQKNIDALEDLVMREITHPSGHVRMAAVRLGEDIFRLKVFPRRFKKDRTEAKEFAAIGSYVLRIKDRILDQAPADWSKREAFNPVIIADLPPSELKSLLLLWDQITFRYRSDDTIQTTYPELELPFSLQWQSDDNFDELDTEPPDVWEAAEYLWSQKVQPTTNTKNALESLEADFTEYLAAMLSPLNLEAQSWIERLRLVRDEESSSKTLLAFTETILPLLEQERWHHDEKLHYIRLFFMLSNCVVQQTKDELPFSRILVMADNALPASHAKQVGELPAALLAAHKALAKFIETQMQSYQDMMRELQKITGDNDSTYTDARLRRMSDIRLLGDFVLHHYIQTYPEDFLKKSPERIAALALDVLNRVNEELSVWRNVLFGRAELSQFGGWKSNMGPAAMRLVSSLRFHDNMGELFILPAIAEYEEESYVGAPFQQQEIEDLADIEHLLTDEATASSSGSLGTQPNQLNPEELESRVAIVAMRHGAADTLLNEAKQRVYEASGNPLQATNDFHQWFLEQFPPSITANEQTFLEIMGVAVDIWNAFPHKELDGQSPQALLQAQLKDNLKDKE